MVVSDVDGQCSCVASTTDGDELDVKVACAPCGMWPCGEGKESLYDTCHGRMCYAAQTLRWVKQGAPLQHLCHSGGVEGWTDKREGTEGRNVPCLIFLSNTNRRERQLDTGIGRLMSHQCACTDNVRQGLLIGHKLVAE